MTFQWVDFRPALVPRRQVTKRWEVVTRTTPAKLLGEIRWWAPWRRYCFFPEAEKAAKATKRKSGKARSRQPGQAEEAA